MITPLKLPAQITLYVSMPCNLRCKNCYLYGIADYDRGYMGTPEKDEMSFEVFRNAIDPILREVENPYVCFMGGEPTLHPQLAEMVNYIKKGRPQSFVDMNTNGTRLHLCAESLVAAGMDAIYVSLDGSCSEVNDAGRGHGAFDRAQLGLEFIRHLRLREGLPVKLAINHTVTRANYLDIADMARFASSMGVDELFINLSIFVRQEEGLAAQRMLRDNLGLQFESWKGFVIDTMVEGINSHLLQAQLDEVANKDWDFKLFIAPIGYTNAELAEYFTPQWGQLLREKGCPVQTFRTTVMPNGDVVPCTIYPDIVIGNLRDEPLDAIWHGASYSRFREFVMRQLLPTCKRCCDLFDETKGDPYSYVNNSRDLHQI